MDERALHLVKIPLRLEQLAALARRRGLPQRDLDDGYLAHSVLREIWQERAPQPFVLRPHRAVVEVWGYCSSAAPVLVEHARAYSDPSVFAVLHSVDDIASRQLPVLPAGRKVGFTVRVCPVVRLSKARDGHRAGAELDAFLARCLGTPRETAVSREAVYSDWFAQRWGAEEAAGAVITALRVTRYQRERLVRRTQGQLRQAHSMERPDVELAGELRVTNGEALVRRLATGVGRHKAFGFGAVMLVAPEHARAAG